MKTIRTFEKKNGDVYEYIYDQLMDCTCITLTVFGEIISQSDWNTGYDAVVEMNEVIEMSDKEFGRFCYNSLKFQTV